jgi:hypothetical protein
MKVVCIDNKDCDYITIGKTYEVININEYEYNIIDDCGDDYWDYDIEFFKTLSDIRNEKINKLLGE